MAIRFAITNSTKFSQFALLVIYFLLALGAWTAIKNLELLEKLSKRLEGYDIVFMYKGNLFGFNLDNDEDDYPEELSTDGTDKRGKADFSKEFAFSIRPENFTCRLTQNLTDPSVFVVIKSRPYEYFQRMAIRQTYGRLLARRLVFVVGMYPDQPDVDDGVDLEAMQFGDILRVDFADIYHNLGFKSLSILRWITLYCPYESFYLQADSDALLYPESILEFARHKMGVPRRIYGHCWRRAPVLRRGKWRVSMRRLAASHYPEYCSGGAYLMTGDVPSALLRALAAPAASPNRARGGDLGAVKSINYMNGSRTVLSANREPGSSSRDLGGSKTVDGYGSKSVRLKIRTVATNEPYMSIDDAFFSGLLAERAVVNRVNHPGFALLDELGPSGRSGMERLDCSPNSPFRTLLASFEYKSPNELRRAWENYQRFEEEC